MNHRHDASALAIVCSALLLACSGSVTPGDGATADTPLNADGAVDTSADAADASAADVSTSDVFTTADHNPLPVIMSRGGPTMSSVQLVVITYQDTSNASAIDTFGGWVGTSDWLATVGTDYGVGPGTLLGSVALPADAPDTITSTQVETMIADGVMAGTIPSPTDHDYSNVLYMVFFPEHTTINLLDPGGGSEMSCSQFGGYHSELQQGALHLVYAVVADCGAGGMGTEIGGQTVTATHEYIEAATDPYPATAPAYQLQDDGSTAWAFIGGEVADMCELSHSTYTDDGYAVQRIWSNSAAMAGDADPCIPVSTTSGPYFNVSVDPYDAQFANAGDTVTFDLTGWSLGPVQPWSLNVIQEGGNIMLTASVNPMTLNNGGSATVSVDVPRGTPEGYAEFEVSSTEMGSTGRMREVWMLTIIVE